MHSARLIVGGNVDEGNNDCGGAEGEWWREGEQFASFPSSKQHRTPSQGNPHVFLLLLVFRHHTKVEFVCSDMQYIGSLMHAP